ncbi:MAG: tRNA-dihydrouridine synthase C, partial [bacterium]
MRILLAPMEGLIDTEMRELLTSVGGIHLCTTEFVRINNNVLSKKEFYPTFPELESNGLTKSGTPVFVQLLGSHPELMAQNAVEAVKLGAKGIDLNFGCPSKKVNSHDGGAVLLKEPSRLFQIVNAVRKHVPNEIPVTAKI